MKITYNGEVHYVKEATWESYLKTARNSIDIPEGKELTKDDMEYIEEIATEIFLEDEGILINEEQAELIEKTKDIKIGNAKSEKQLNKELNKDKQKDKVDKERKLKPIDLEKIDLVKDIFEALGGNENFSNLEITNPTKILEFEYNGKYFKLDLVYQKNKTKAKQANE